MTEKERNRPIGSRPNQHAITCHRCCERVQPGKGFIFKDRPTGPWVGEHDECPETDGMNDDDGGGFGEGLHWGTG